MAIRAKNREILGRDVAPVAVDVFNFDWNPIAIRVTLIPAAALATITERFYNVAAQYRIEKRPRL
jgi:hypothetical protein